jgi:hypothetical protein
MIVAVKSAGSATVIFDLRLSAMIHTPNLKSLLPVGTILVLHWSEYAAQDPAWLSQSVHQLMFLSAAWISTGSPLA